MKHTFLLAVFVSIFCCLFVSGSVGTSAKSRSIEDVSNPIVSPEKCGREGVPRSAICDPDLLLTKEDKDAVEGFINAISAAQVAVAVVNRMDRSKGELLLSSIEQASELFARRLHDLWGVGDKTTNNGVLVFLSIEDRAVFVSTGDGVQDRLTLRVIQALIDSMKPFLRQKAYGKALELCILQIDLVLSGKRSEILSRYGPGATSFSSSGGSDNYGAAIIFAAFVGIVAVGFVTKLMEQRKMRQLERGQRALGTLMHEIDNTEEGNKYFTLSCPICLEEFQNPQNIIPTTTAATPAPVVAEGEKKDAQRAMALRCGHTFCFSCLETYLTSADKGKCPICRMPVDEKDDLPRPGDGGGSLGGVGSAGLGGLGNGGLGGGGLGRRTSARSHSSSPLPTSSVPVVSCADAFRDQPQMPGTSRFVHRAPEIRFRLNRMHHLYPDMMTAELLRTANYAVDRGSFYDLRSEINLRSTQVQQTIIKMKEARESARQSGSRGSSRIFGGGHSSGGGGGSW